MCLYRFYNQFIMMEQEQFDEFQEATYSQSNSQPQQPFALIPNSVPAASGLQPIENGQGEYPNIHPSAFPSSLLASAPLENSSGGEEQSIWPELGKINSAQGATHEPFMLDFGKSYSLTDQISSTAGNDFLGLDFGAKVEPQNISFPQQTTSDTSQIGAKQSIITVSNDFLGGLTAPQTGFELLGSKKEQPDFGEGWGKVETVQNSAENSFSTNLNAPVRLNATNDFDLFAPMTENASNKQQKQVKVEVKEEKEVLVHEHHLLQFGSQPTITENKIIQQQTVQKVGDSQPIIFEEQDFKSAQPNQEENDCIQAYAPTSNTQATYHAAEKAQVGIFESEVEPKNETRKESDQFEFYQAKAAEPEANIRKQSQEQVFQGTQQSPSIPEETPFTPIVQEQLGENKAQGHQQEPAPAVEYKPLVKQQRQKEGGVPQQQLAQEDEDQFGDFEETTQVQDTNNRPQQVRINEKSHEDNTVHIKQEYSSSPQTDFYQSRQKQLQNFVDSLPDYSFLFLKGFLPS